MSSPFCKTLRELQSRTVRSALRMVPALLLLSLACRPMEASEIWIHPNLMPVVEAHIDKTMSPHDIWRQSGMRLTIVPNPAATEIVHKIKIKYLVMVSFPYGARLGQELAHDEKALAYFPGDFAHPGFALMNLDSASEVDDLAVAAHAVGHPSCGALELLTLNTLAATVQLTAPFFSDLIHLDAVADLVNIDATQTTQNLDASIRALEQLGTRHHTSESGLGAPTKVQAMLASAAGSGIHGWSLTTFAHTSTKQKSVIAKIPGVDDASGTGPVVIIGAHLDSINKFGGAVAPGADDDASGIATLVEIVRTLANKGTQFHRTIELHAYAAEEVGLYGSIEIADAYAKDGRQVAAMLQIDMDSWSQDPATKTVFLVENDTSSVLTRSAKNLLTSYLGGDYAEKRLKSGTSDHKSWTNAGFPAVFPFEDPLNYNEALHTPSDTSSTINNKALAVRFVGLALAFLGHHAGIAGAEESYAHAAQTQKQATEKDLHLAIVKGASDGVYKLSVAAPAGVKTVELCEVTEAGGRNCSKELVIPASVSGPAAGRAFFAIADEIPIRDGIRIAMFGYDEQNALKVQRSVRLQKR